MSQPSLDAANLHQLLRHGEIRDCQPLPWGSNYTFAVVLEISGLPAGIGIYKPRRGESPLWDFPSGTLYRREYAAWILSQCIGWDFIPVTVVRSGPYGIGSIQWYVEPDDETGYEDLLERDTLRMQQMALFDAITNNADRKAGHCLPGKDGRAWGIDHGLTFNVDYKLRTVIWEFRGQPIPPVLEADLRRFRDTRLDAATRWLSAWLDPAEIRKTWRRLDRLLEQGTFPLPVRQAYNVPWPPY